MRSKLVFSIVLLGTVWAYAIVGGELVEEESLVSRSTVALVARSSFGRVSAFCTGTLIDREWVLTAAHCVQSPRRISVGFGLDTRENDFELRNVVDKIVHPNFSPDLMRGGLRDLPEQPVNDIALLKISPAPKDYRPANIGSMDQLQNGESLVLAGFGQTAFPSGDGIGQLRSVETIFDRYHRASLEFLFGPTPGRSACRGDSGGPAYVKSSEGALHVVGVTSRGGGCVGAGIYTDVDAFQDWIRRQM